MKPKNAFEELDVHTLELATGGAANPYAGMSNRWLAGRLARIQHEQLLIDRPGLAR